jgi:hypothetical protein
MARMLDRAYVQSHNVFEEPLDIGALAEVALFYGEVELVLGRGSLSQLLMKYGADSLVEFVSQGYVNAHYSHQFTAIHTETSRGYELHRPALISSADRMEADVVRVFRQCTERSGYGQRKANAFLSAVAPIAPDEDWSDQIRANFGNETLVRSAIESTALHVLGPGDGMAVKVTGFEWSENALRIELDDNWPPLQLEYQRRRGSSLSAANLLSPFVGSLTDLQVASRFGADISTGQLGSRLLGLKCAELQRATSGRLDGIAEFQDLTLRGRDVRTALNSGAQDLRSLMTLLDRADRFKSWIAGQPADSDLAAQYIDEVTATTWADSVPLKAIRFASATFAGSVAGGDLGAGLGVVAGLADMFLLERILKGWKPNQFVEKELDPFVRTEH